MSNDGESSAEQRAVTSARPSATASPASGTSPASATAARDKDPNARFAGALVVATWFFALGWLAIIGGVVAGIAVAARTDGSTAESFGGLILFAVLGTGYAMPMFAFGFMVKLLHAIELNTRK